MEIDTSNIEWIEFDVFEGFSELTSATYLRHGGTSTGAFVSLNASDNVGDHPDNVKVNRELIRKNAEVDLVVYAKQIQGNKIVEITIDNASATHECDGLITKEKKIALAITHADCQAAVFYDPTNQVLGACHVGWKGLVNNIYQDMVDQLCSFGCKKENIYVAVSPSLSQEYAEFKNYKEEFPKEFWRYKNEESCFDLRQWGEDQLINAGIPAKQIEIVKICTYSNPKDYYSYRRDKVTGRNATIIGLKE